MRNATLAPLDTFDWLSLSDLQKQAETAYNAACSEMTPQDDLAFTDPETGTSWADRAEFFEALIRHLEHCLHVLYRERVIHKSIAEHAEGARGLSHAVATEGSCGPCG